MSEGCSSGPEAMVIDGEGDGRSSQDAVPEIDGMVHRDDVGLVLSVLGVGDVGVACSSACDQGL